MSTESHFNESGSSPSSRQVRNPTADNSRLDIERDAYSPSRAPWPPSGRCTAYRSEPQVSMPPRRPTVEEAPYVWGVSLPHGVAAAAAEVPR